MPTYDYRCPKCGDFEHWQSIKEDPLSACPTCGEPVQRLISSNVNIIFKGSGFYHTDNRSESYKKAAKAEAESSGGGGSSSSGSGASSTAGASAGASTGGSA